MPPAAARFAESAHTRKTARNGIIADHKVVRIFGTRTSDCQSRGQGIEVDRVVDLARPARQSRAYPDCASANADIRGPSLFREHCAGEDRSRPSSKAADASRIGLRFSRGGSKS